MVDIGECCKESVVELEVELKMRAILDLQSQHFQRAENRTKYEGLRLQVMKSSIIAIYHSVHFIRHQRQS